MEYEVKTEQFTGPLDLLLHLIKEHDMDLMDLDVAIICDQYLAYIEMMDPSLLERVSEYLVMAAWLIEMKSRLLLPSEKIDEEDDYEADRQKMVLRLLEKSRINDVLDAFDEAYKDRQAMHTKIPSTMDAYFQDVDQQIPDNLEVYDLIQAMQKVLERQALLAPLESKIAMREISIEERTDQIKDFFSRHLNERIDFEDLFDEGDRYFAIVTFLAILSLVKDHELDISQEKNFEKIYVIRREDHGA